jgi:hypothetical protein
MVLVKAKTTESDMFAEHRYSTFAHFAADLMCDKRVETGGTVVVLDDRRNEIRLWNQVWDVSKSYPDTADSRRLAWLELCRINKIRPEGFTMVESLDPAYDWPRYKGPIPG